MKFWHERSALQSVAVQAPDWQLRYWTTIFTILALQSVAVRRSTRNEVSAHYFHRFFSLPFFPPVSSVITILKEGVFGLKNLFSES